MFSLATVVVVGLIAGCGSSKSPIGDTSVTLLASSTANDQLSAFHISFNSITLTSQSGNTVTVFDTPQSAEFIHVNGTAEPLLTVSIPQDVYTSATATISKGQFTCAVLDPSANEFDTTTFIVNGIQPSNITMNLTAPVRVIGTSMGLLLDLQVSKSASWVTCDPRSILPYSITPTFNVTPVTITAQPTNSSNGRATDIEGVISSVDAGEASFDVTGADGPSWQVGYGTKTVFQGVTDASQLSVGMPVDMDVALQEDGSLLATRVEVADTDTTTLSASSGPLEFVTASLPILDSIVVEGQGILSETIDAVAYNFGNAAFQTLNPLTDINSLPFSASFNATNMVPGQNVYVTTHALASASYPPATNILLIPQTIDGTVSEVSSEDGFTTYTVALASYDLFPNMAVQSGQNTLLTDPGTVVVYADSNTQMLNSGTIGVGSVMRFNGLVFNDNGTLRMDCAQVNDGVAE